MLTMIVAEDELLTREGIIRSVGSDSCGFTVAGEAEDGETALRLVRELHPDVLLTDIAMPRMDGLQLIEQVREESPETRILIVSGYDDFRYVQRAIQLGVQDYLLKPVLPEQIREMLGRVEEDIHRRRKFLDNIDAIKQQVMESLPLLRERFYHELVQGRLAGEEIAGRQRYLQLDLSGALFGVVLIRFRHYAEVHDPAVRKEDMIQCFLMDILRELFPRGYNVHAFVQSDTQIALLICAGDHSRQKAFTVINQCVQKMVASLKKYLNVTAYAAVGSLSAEVTGFAGSFAEAEEAMRYHFTDRNSPVIHYEDIRLREESAEQSLAGIQESLILHARLGDTSRCHQAVETLFAAFTGRQDPDPRRIRLDVFEMVMLFFHGLRDGAGESPALRQLHAGALDEIQRCERLDALKQWTLQFFDRCMAVLEAMRTQRSLSLKDRVVEMIRLNVSDEDFSLNDVAARLYISPNHLRTLFKQQSGESFVEFLTRERMEKAAELLKDPTMKIQQTAELVGYSNQRYFAMCFKKHYRVTPSDFREYHLQQREDIIP